MAPTCTRPAHRRIPARRSFIFTSYHRLLRGQVFTTFRLVSIVSNQRLTCSNIWPHPILAIQHGFSSSILHSCVQSGIVQTPFLQPCLPAFGREDQHLHPLAFHTSFLQHTNTPQSLHEKMAWTRTSDGRQPQRDMVPLGERILLAG